MEVDSEYLPKEQIKDEAVPSTLLDLEDLAFSSGNHFNSSAKVSLPHGTTQEKYKDYEEVIVPPPKAKPYGKDERKIPIAELAEWMRPAFTSESLNRLQSQVYPNAFDTTNPENLLVCAPTGAGKTNVAMLTILKTIEEFRSEGGRINLNAFKMIYIAPMKALVQEVVQNFSKRLKPFGIAVSELTGDRQMTKAQIAETQMIVTTPEKWDVVTRKSTDRSYTQLVRLIIIDEIHLLHDDRGPVLESIVARTRRQTEQSGAAVRLVGLSATLPNYSDVAYFLGVPKHNIKFFDASWRPVPLQQMYVGISEKKPIKRLALMNEIVYTKVIERVARHQIMVFTHSRKDTVKTAKSIKDMAIEKETFDQIMKDDATAKTVLKEAAEDTKNQELKDLLPYGLAVHHAGMARTDRALVEALFDKGFIKVLVCTATLAWGVNLPAHTVIIKGTQIYSPEKGSWVELSPQDVFQMLGRAGRPQHDSSGEGIIVTTMGEMPFYLSLLNTQLPIESQFITRLADHLNAEIVLGTIKDREEAVQWLTYTYLYVRMRRAPAVYGISMDTITADPTLRQRRVDLIHTAATLLEKSSMLKYDKRSGNIQSMEFGRIASHYYIGHNTMATYVQHLKPSLTLIELIRIFALSDEFKFIPVREDEKLELQKLVEKVPIPIKESIEEASAKINVLLQAYISQLNLEGFAMIADMVYVTQSASRLLRAIFEICLKRGWAQLSRKALDLCKMVEKRSWYSMSPLRQFPKAPLDLVQRLEKKNLQWDRMYDMDPAALGQLVNTPALGKLLHKFIHQFPRLELQVQIQPVTRSILKLELTLTPDFAYDAEKVHGASEMFWVLVEDVDSECILYHDQFILKARYAAEEHIMDFYVPLFEPLPPNYFISVVSDRWLRSETKLAVSFKHLILPERYPAHTELLDLQPLPVSALRNKSAQSLYNFSYFNKIQTQVFNTLYTTSDNVLIAAPSGSGKGTCAEIAMFREWSHNEDSKIVYIAPFESILAGKYANWKRSFGQFKKEVVLLTGELTADLKSMASGDVILATPTSWDMMSRRWRSRKNVQKVSLYIADKLHLIGSAGGHTYEIITSRMRFMAAQLEKPIRIVALGTSMANAQDLGEWIGATVATTFNFSPRMRPGSLDIRFQTFNIQHFASLMLAMVKPAYQAITQYAQDHQAIIFVPSRKLVGQTAVELLAVCASMGAPNRFLKAKIPTEILDRIQDKILLENIALGVGIYHDSLSNSDKKAVLQAYRLHCIQVLVAPRDVCWSLDITCHLSLIMGTQYYHGKEHRYVDYPLTEILEMMGKAGGPGDTEDMKSLCVMMCQTVKKTFYKKFLDEALPVESHISYHLHDHFNAEIEYKTIENKQEAVDYLTWTFMYRRLLKNPNYYNLTGTTHRHLSDHLSEIVESTLKDLAVSKCITIEDDDDLSSLNLGSIAAYYYISYVTIETFSISLRENTKLRGLLEILCASYEFEDVVVRHQEDAMLERLHERCPVKLREHKFADPHNKSNILLQTYFSRVALPADAEADQKFILGMITKLLYAMVNVISAHGWLNPALAAMELSQMTIQAMWDRDSVLKQLPHFDDKRVALVKERGVETIFDVLDLDDAAVFFEEIGLSSAEVEQVAAAVNRYPDVKVTYEVVDPENVKANQPFTIQITVNREGEEDDVAGPVYAPHFPHSKEEGWWLVVSDPKEKQLHGIKNIVLQQSSSVKLQITAPKRAGKHDWQLLLMSDCYMGCDQEHPLSIDVGESPESDDDDDDDDDDDESTEDVDMER